MGGLRGAGGDTGVGALGVALGRLELPRGHLRHHVAVAEAVPDVVVPADLRLDLDVGCGLHPVGVGPHLVVRGGVAVRVQVHDVAHVEDAKAVARVGDIEVVAVPDDPAGVDALLDRVLGSVQSVEGDVVGGVHIGPAQQDVPVLDLRAPGGRVGPALHEGDPDALLVAGVVGLELGRGAVAGRRERVVLPARVPAVVGGEQLDVPGVAPQLVVLGVGDAGEALGDPLLRDGVVVLQAVLDVGVRGGAERVAGAPRLDGTVRPGQQVLHTRLGQYRVQAGDPLGGLGVHLAGRQREVTGRGRATGSGPGAGAEGRGDALGGAGLLDPGLRYVRRKVLRLCRCRKAGERERCLLYTLYKRQLM